MPEKVLIVEDEPALVETLQYNLVRQGYAVLAACDGITGLALARSERPDVIILDVMLPGIDGLEVCRTLRPETSAPILMLTARVEEIDRVVGLEIGADDYLGKPFSMRELLARIKALLRRMHLNREEIAAREASDPSADVPRAKSVLVFDDLVVDLDRREVLRQGQIVPLKPKEFELLVFLARNRGMVLTRELILERVWGWQHESGNRAVDVYVRWLREKLEADPAQPTRIVTVRGVGYRFEG
jgi:DNA-binding response OmpR family regulator